MTVFLQPDLDEVIASISQHYVGQMKVLSVGRDWAITLLLCGMDPPLTFFPLSTMGLKLAINLVCHFREGEEKTTNQSDFKVAQWLTMYMSYVQCVGSRLVREVCV